MSQFQFLQADFAAVYKHAQEAEARALSDPRGACFHARLALEAAVHWMYRHDSTLRKPYETHLAALIHESTFQDAVEDRIFAKLRLIKNLGNKAVHETRAVPPQTAITAVRELFHFSYWLVRTYAHGAKPAPETRFDPERLEKTVTIKASTAAGIKKQHEESKIALTALEAENKRLLDEIASIKKTNAALPGDGHDYNEAETRDAFIDVLLREAGWPLDQDRDCEYPVSGMPNTTGEGFVDYVLWGDDGKPLGLVEAKRMRKDPREGKQQAKLYADALEREYGQRPVIFYSNGYEHWMWDDTRYPPRQVQGFLKKDELELAIQRRKTLRPLKTADINRKIAERHYQTRAIGNIAEAFEKDCARKTLLVMATGSGKTRTVIALADLLMRANWAKRILFLADRTALVNQTVGAFKEFMPQASPVNLVTDKGGHGRVYVSTYPTMMNLIDEMRAGKRIFGPGHFDLVVIDEAHRSVYRKYGAIFEYFDSLLIGLTATPKDEIDRDTYRLFDLERGMPTDAYSLAEAVKDEFLVPPKGIYVDLKFPQRGIEYDKLPDEEKDEWDALDWGEDGAPDRVESNEVNKWLFNENTADKALKYLMENGLKVEDGDRLGKTIIFARNHNHAEFIVDRFNKSYPHLEDKEGLKGSFAQVIDFKVKYTQKLIDDFSAPEKAPHIAVSVDMLDTGIDIPEVVNLVFFKSVGSKTKFWQMIGRGTRLCPNLFGLGRDKTCFYVFDICRNIEFFNENLGVPDGAAPRPLSARLFGLRLELAAELAGDKDETRAGLRGEVITHLRNEVNGMKLDNFVVRTRREFVEKYQDDAPWAELNETARHELDEHIAGLPSAAEDNDTDAKRFDYLMLRAELAVLRGKGLEKAKKRIKDCAAALETLENITDVQRRIELIQEIQTDGWWLDVTAPILDEARRKLRGLMFLAELKKQQPVYTGFEDEMGEGREIEIEGVPAGVDIENFRKKAMHFLKAQEDHITIQKLRRNEALTAQDLAELEKMFLEAGIGEDEDLEKAKENGGLGVFVRSLVGLDCAAAKRAFADFEAARDLSANQNKFINMMIDHLTDQGVMEPDRLYESPFIDIHDQGVAGVFESADVIALRDILENIRRQAAA